MITFDLQTGFQGESIEIRVGQKIVFEAERVRTKKLLGLAQTVVVKEYEPGHEQSIVVKVDDLPELTIDGDELDSEAYIGISIEEGKLIHLISDQPFGYG